MMVINQYFVISRSGVRVTQPAPLSKDFSDKIWDQFTASKQETFWYYESLYKEFKRYLKNHPELIKAYKNKVDEMKRIIT